MTHELAKAVAEQIAYEKRMNGISTAELMRRTGLSDKSLRLKLQGERDFTFSDVQLVAGALRMDALDLIAEAGKRLEETPGLDS